MYTKPLVVCTGMGTWKDHLKRAIGQMGSQPKLAKAMGCSQSKISWLLLTAEQISAEDALLIDRATDGEVSASELRPDLWPTKDHVPTAAEAHP
jgi:DNA-binding transcriptional regulator YdaS (Cro superfamily)